MHSRPSFQRPQHQRGFTLMEILVAVAIFATVMIVALLLYDRSNQVFKTSNEAAEMQQNTRVAYEKMVADLRMAGFDYKRNGTPAATAPQPWVSGRNYSVGTLVTPTSPNGHVYRCINSGQAGPSQPSWTTGKGDIVNDKAPLQWQEAGAPVYEQPDEQIEYAHTAAVTIRANFDYNQPPDNGRETVLENSTGGSFPSVTTGNDEIVTYALVSKSGNANANKDTISFYADVNNGGTPSRQSFPGGAPEREIKITGVDLTNAYPPYTLMRYTLNDAGAVVETALADNIRSMNLTYWEDAAATRALTDLNNVAINNVGGDGKYDPATPNAKLDGRIIRGKIRAVTVNIVGMNPQIDYAYTHPTDTVAPNYRQYALVSTVVGRNLGLEGVPENTNNPPGPPTVQSACNGYCGVALITWKPDEATIDATYTVLYDKSSAGSFTGVLPAGSQTTFAVDLTQQLPDATTWYFKVAATNPYGTTVSKNYIAVDVRNATKPDAPKTTGSVAGVNYGVFDTPGKPSELLIRWRMPETNAAGAPACTTGTTPNVPIAAELKGYRVWRSKTAGFTPGAAGSTMIMNENSGGATTDGIGNWSFIDTTVAACETYYYKVVAVEWCQAAATYNTTGNADTGISDPSTEVSGAAQSVANPRMPLNLKMHPDTYCDAIAGKCFPVILTWDKVTQDINGNALNVEDYVIHRQKKVDGVNVGSNDLAGDISNGATTFSEPSSLDYTDPSGAGGKVTFEYTVQAVTGYLAGGACERYSDKALILVPDACSTGATVVPNMLGPGSGTIADPWQNVDSLQVVAYATKPIVGVEVSADGAPFSGLAFPYQYNHNDPGDGRLIPVIFRVKTIDCTETIATYIQNDAPSCLLTGTVVNVSGSTTALDINVNSTSGENITISNIAITWAGQSGYAWNSITLPSGTVVNASGTTTSARTANFVPAGGDKNINPNGSYKIRMNLAGTAVALGASVTNVIFSYTVPSTGTVVHACTINPFNRCSVTATATFINNFQIGVKISNASTDQLDLQTLKIAWTNIPKLDWADIVLPSGAVLPVTTATNGGTETFTIPASDKTVVGSGSYTLLMRFTTTSSNPPPVDAANVGAVELSYKTPTSGTTVLACRGK